MTPPTLTDAKSRLVDLLKRRGPSQTADLARSLRLTDVAIRQHLAALERAEIVESRVLPPNGRGRPAVQWTLTGRAHGLFPDRHSELTVALIGAVRESVGEKGLRRIVEVRARDQVNFYQTLMPRRPGSLRRRIERLAQQRSAEGYMAEVRQEAPGVYLLIEHHCPICEAAKACTGLCAAELDVFHRVLGEDLSIERIEHVLSQGARCVYRIRKSNTDRN